MTYAPGEWTALVGQESWALLQTSLNDPAAHRLWHLMRTTLSPGDLLPALASADLLTLPSFAIALGGEAPVILVRGAAVAVVDTRAGEADQVSAPAAVTWTEYVATGPVRSLRLQAAGFSGNAKIPTSSGVCAASELEINFEEAPVATLAGTSGPERDATLIFDATPISAPEERPYPRPFTDDEPRDPGERDFDHLFGLTDSREVEDAARRTDDDGVVASKPSAFPGTSAGRTRKPDPRIQRATTATGGADGGGLIDSVPLAPASVISSRGDTGDAQPTAPSHPALMGADVVTPLLDDDAASPGAAVVDDADTDLERTMARPRRSRPTPAAAHDGMQPSVRAVVCASGHPNPPTAVTCRICSNEIQQQDVQIVPRPSLGDLVLADGTRVALDRPALFGRVPQWDGRGGERPNTVALNSPFGDISRNHVLVTLDEWHVLVSDLRSTNGTYVTAPGGEPMRLRAEEPVPIVPGSQITLSDEVVLVFEPGR